MNRLFVGIFTTWLLLGSLRVAVGLAADPAIPWQAVNEEAVSLLQRYIQIDTTNPPGEEIKAAQFFKQIFDREGIDARIVESAPGRGNIYAALRGKGMKPTVILLNHMDVVPAEPSLWKEAPFSGALKDGHVWGRGALDMKGPAILQLMSMLVLKRRNVSLKADIVFLGTADEEAGGSLGAGFLVENHPELFKNAGLVLNEGGNIRVGEGGRARYYGVSVSEKAPLWLKLTAPGTPGHGATPGNVLAVNRLIAALNRIVQYQTPIKVLPEVQKFYAATAALHPEPKRTAYQNLAKALGDSRFAAEFVKDRIDNAHVRNTIAITGIRGSDKVNVIPAFATAQLDVRLLPGEKPAAFIEELRKVIADESIKIEVMLSFPPITSPPHPEAMKVITDVAKTQDAGAPVVSPLLRGFTDCHFFREKGIPCLGFMPLRRSASEEGLVHGIDERISVQNLISGIHMMYDIVRRLAAE